MALWSCAELSLEVSLLPQQGAEAVEGHYSWMCPLLLLLLSGLV